MDPELRKDDRWQLIERIVASNSFQKSTRLKDLLCYLAEVTLQGTAQDLSEHQIGTAALGKPEDYSVVEDSAVRVYMRQLRLRLHEYFNGEGRQETWIVDFPKGSYTAVFRNVEPSAVATSTQPAPRRMATNWLQALPWTLAVFFLITTVAVWFLKPALARPPWPLSALFDQGKDPVQLVVSDANYGMLLMFNNQQLTLSQYLNGSFWSPEARANDNLTGRESRLAGYLSASMMASYADVVVATSLMHLSGSSGNRLVVRPARNLQPRDLAGGNFIFVGNIRSNPWVSYFQSKLNFQELDSPAGERPLPTCFHNLHPKSGEQETYCGTPFDSNSGEAYAVISLLPLPSGNGSVLILQGLQYEGTEASAIFLADPGSRRELEQALGVSGNPKEPVYFEALIRTKSINRAPIATSSIVATRLIHP